MCTFDVSDRPAHSDCLPLANSIGVLFQIVDDYRNFDNYADMKGFCDDLSEGKFSFPIIQAFAADPSNPFLLSILKQKSKDHGLKAQARDYMTSVGAFDRTRRHIKSLESETVVMLEDIKVQTDQEGCEACVVLRSIRDSHSLRLSGNYIRALVLSRINWIISLRLLRLVRVADMLGHELTG